MGKRKYWDRKEATLVRDLDSFHKVIPHIMPKRCDSEVYINEKVDITNLLKWLEKINNKRTEKINFFYAMNFAIAKVIYNRKLLNRFISNKRFYQRKDISLAFVIKTEKVDDGLELFVFLNYEPDDTLESVAKKLRKKIDDAVKNKDSEVNNLINFFTNGPVWFTGLVAKTLRFMDKHRLLPEMIRSGDYNYATANVINLGSIKCNSIYHHLNEWGTNSLIISIGIIHKENVIDANGKSQLRDIVEIGVTLDERIADGFYFAKSVNLLKYLLNNPELLEKDIKEKVDFKQ